MPKYFNFNTMLIYCYVKWFDQNNQQPAILQENDRILSVSWDEWTKVLTHDQSQCPF